MKTFKDNQDRDWQIAINIGTAKRVKEKLDVDLLQPEIGEPPLLTRLGTDELLLGEVICCLLEEQFEALDMTADDMRKVFEGKPLLDAHMAFYEDMLNFFRARGRIDRAAMVEKQTKILTAAIARATTVVDGVKVKTVIDEIFGKVKPKKKKKAKKRVKKK